MFGKWLCHQHGKQPRPNTFHLVVSAWSVWVQTHALWVRYVVESRPRRQRDILWTLRRILTTASMKACSGQGVKQLETWTKSHRGKRVRMSQWPTRYPPGQHRQSPTPIVRHLMGCQTSICELPGRSSQPHGQHPLDRQVADRLFGNHARSRVASLAVVAAATDEATSTRVRANQERRHRCLPSHAVAGALQQLRGFDTDHFICIRGLLWCCLPGGHSKSGDYTPALPLHRVQGHWVLRQKKSTKKEKRNIKLISENLFFLILNDNTWETKGR